MAMTGRQQEILTMARSPHLAAEAYRTGFYPEHRTFLDPHYNNPYAAMYMSPDPSDPNLSKLSNWQQRRPNLTLNRSSQWSYPTAHNALPTPPMSDSPTSPRRPSQVSDSYAPLTGSTAGAVPNQGIASLGSTMATQILPPQTLTPQYYSTGYQSPAHDARFQYQPRQVYQPAAHIPQHYVDLYPSQPPQAGPLGFAPQQARSMMPPSGFGGPMSVPGGSAQRMPKTSRRTKAHVAKACQNCKKAHLSCDEARPCGRCVGSNKQSTCIDVEHKKRGRPRLREDKDSRQDPRNIPTSFSSAMGATMTAGSAPGVSSNPSMGLSRANSMRQQTVSSGLQPGFMGSDSRAGTVTDVFYRSQSDLPPGPAVMIAYLNLDMIILRTNDAFKSLFLNGGDARGRPLSDFTDQSHLLGLHQVRNELHAERQRREPTLLPSIYAEEKEQQAVDVVSDNDIEQISQGFEDRSENWIYVLPNGQKETMISRVKLARTSAYFAVLTLRRVAQPASRRQVGPYRGGPIEAPPASLAYGQSAPNPREATFAQGQHTAYQNAPPTSPFYSMSTLGTTLPPTTGSSFVTGPAPRQDLGYPGSEIHGSSLLTAAMQPPPHPPHYRSPTAVTQMPTPNTDNRPTSSRDKHRPEPIGSIVLPPIGSSAPATPSHTDFITAGHSGRALLTPERAEGSTSSQIGSASGPEDSARKRRRMDITDIVDQ